MKYREITEKDLKEGVDVKHLHYINWAFKLNNIILKPNIRINKVDDGGGISILDDYRYQGTLFYNFQAIIDGELYLKNKDKYQDYIELKEKRRVNMKFRKIKKKDLIRGVGVKHLDYINSVLKLHNIILKKDIMITNVFHNAGIKLSGLNIGEITLFNTYNDAMRGRTAHPLDHYKDFIELEIKIKEVKINEYVFSLPKEMDNEIQRNN